MQLKLKKQMNNEIKHTYTNNIAFIPKKKPATVDNNPKEKSSRGLASLNEWYDKVNRDWQQKLDDDNWTEFLAGSLRDNFGIAPTSKWSQEDQEKFAQLFTEPIRKENNIPEDRHTAAHHSRLITHEEMLQQMEEAWECGAYESGPWNAPTKVPNHIQDRRYR